MFKELDIEGTRNSVLSKRKHYILTEISLKLLPTYQISKNYTDTNAK